MPRINDSSVAKLRDAVDMVELVNGYTDLRRNGSQYMGRCPFHEDNSPSFSVNPIEKVYHCFGCGVGGDLFKFVMEKEGLDFVQSIEWLADQTNFELEYEELDPRAAEKQKQRERLLELLDRATKFYERTLNDADEAQAARDYLAGRGFSAEVLKKYRVGYSPKAWDKLFVPALRQGFSEQELLDAGLAQRNDRGQLYDRFRGRIMFPLADKKGQVRGFGARGMRDSDKPKYLNSADGPVFHKGSQIFGADLARAAAAKKKRVIAVEGYADVLALHQAGFEEVVAVMGTAMTEQQAAELARLAPNVYLALDADESGRKAALRAAGELEGRRDAAISVIRIPEGKDPDELLRTLGPEGFEQAIASAVTVPEFAIDQVFEGAESSDPRVRDQQLVAVREILSAISSRVLRDEMIARAADRLNVSVSAIAENLKASDNNGPARQSASRVTNIDRPERMFMAMCLSNPQVGKAFLEKLQEISLSTQLMGGVRDYLVRQFDRPMDGVASLKPELRDAVTEVAMLSEREFGTQPKLEEGFLTLKLSSIDRQAKTDTSRSKSEIALERDEVVESLKRIQYPD